MLLVEKLGGAATAVAIGGTVRCGGGGVFGGVSELGCRLLIFVRMGCAFDGSYVSRLELEMLYDVRGCGVGINSDD